MHNGWVTVGGEKMSKSLGNFTSLTDLLEKSDGRAYRLLVLRSHYRAPIEVTPDTIIDAERGLERLDGIARRLALSSPVMPVVLGDRAGLDGEVIDRFVSFMDNDLQTPQALGLVFDTISRANSAADAQDLELAARLGATALLLAGAMGLDARVEASSLDAETQALIVARDEARAAKDFAQADALRDELIHRGWVVEDTATGTAVRR